jgi:serine/threonine protein kinase/formylglycine-generating enzyme required for sulfatase activity
MKECIQCHYCFDDSSNFCAFDNKPLIGSPIIDLVISGRYILEKRLGKGGMGIVYKANHKFLKSSHAIKVILPDLVQQDKSLLIRFRQEAVLAASIDHPNVIRVTDFGVENETMPYLVMEYVDGDSLTSYLQPDKPLALDKAYELFHPIAMGVSEAHRRGITHRDLKPENIIVQKGLPFRKAVKVLDFGLAKIKSLESFGSLVQAKTMSIVGSPPYMSPEQWQNDDIDHYTDIYGLGIILFQMLTGRLPFQGDTIPAVMYKHLMTPTPSFSSLGVPLAPEIEAVVGKALEKNREDRHPSVEHLLHEFENALGKSGVTTSVGINTTSYIPQSFKSNPDNLTASYEEETGPLSETQKQRLFSYFDSSEKPDLLADGQLAQDFLQAQDRAEEAKVKADQADKLVNELAEAQRIAEEAQRRAVEAKQRVEIDVRRQVEAELENKRAAEQQERQKAEALRLSEEAEARRKAEERANYLAQAALEAQKLAEEERKKWEQEARQREIEENVRRKAEEAVSELTEQAADSKKKYEEAKKEASNEAELRKIAEAKRLEIENELQTLAKNEVERRKLAEAEALRLSKEAEARKKAEERANYLAKTALEAQRVAEQERKKWEQEAHQREMEEGFRRKAEIAVSELTEQVADSKRQYEEAKKEAEAEAEQRRIAEAKRQKIESDLQALANKEAEQRKQAEIEAQKKIQEQAERFEKEALAAQERVEEARRLAELEAQKREEAEAAQRRAEEEARRLAEEIVEAQKHIEEMRLHTTADAQKQNPNSPDIHSYENLSDSAFTSQNSSSAISSSAAQFYQTGSDIKDTAQIKALESPQETGELKMPISSPDIPRHLLTTNSIPKRKTSTPLIVAGISALFLAIIAGGYGYFSATNTTPENFENNTAPVANGSVTAPPTNTASPISNEKTAASQKERILVQGGSFKMGSDDVTKTDVVFGNQFPAHDENVNSFYMDKTEVSNAEYAEFVQTKGYLPPETWKSGKMPDGQDKLPVTSVTLTDAQAYAKWISERENKFCRLPEEEEWEFAARNGSQQNYFPWGNEWRPVAANIDTGKIVEAGTSPGDITANGIKDLLGNVAEWTSTKYSLYNDHPAKAGEDKNMIKDLFVTRGMHFDKSVEKPSNKQWMLPLRRPALGKTTKSPFLGFRLVCDKP